MNISLMHKPHICAHSKSYVTFGHMNLGINYSHMSQTFNVEKKLYRRVWYHFGIHRQWGFQNWAKQNHPCKSTEVKFSKNGFLKSEISESAIWWPTLLVKKCQASKNKLFRPKKFLRIPTWSKVMHFLLILNLDLCTSLKMT